MLSTVLKEDRHAPVIQLLCDRAFEWALGASDTIDRVVVRDSPSWTPKFVDHFVGDRIYRELVDFTDKVRRNPEHDLRQSVNRLLYEFADDLQHDDLTIARTEAVKARLMARAEVQNAAATAWSAAKKMITESVDDPSSELRTRIADTVVRIGETLRDDASVETRWTAGWNGRRVISSINTAPRSPPSSPRPSSVGTPMRPVAGSNCMSVVTCSSFVSTARWWVRWRV